MQDVETCEVRTRAMCYRRTPVNVGKAPLKGEEEAHRKERRTYIGVSREPCRCASKDKVPRAKGRIATGEPGRPSSGNTTHLERKKKRQRKVPAHTFIEASTQGLLPGASTGVCGLVGGASSLDGRCAESAARMHEHRGSKPPSVCLPDKHWRELVAHMSVWT